MSSVYSDKFEGVAFRSGAERAHFEAAVRALWAVRVLDRWAERNEGDALCAKKQSQRGNEYWECPDHKQLHHAATPDAARIAAAEALVAEDPSLGEGL